MFFVVSMVNFGVIIYVSMEFSFDFANNLIGGLLLWEITVLFSFAFLFMVFLGYVVGFILGFMFFECLFFMCVSECDSFAVFTVWFTWNTWIDFAFFAW